jgi:hypothetical protein
VKALAHIVTPLGPEKCWMLRYPFDWSCHSVLSKRNQTIRCAPCFPVLVLREMSQMTALAGEVEEVAA